MAELKKEVQKLREMELELERMIQEREAKRREYSEKAMRGEMGPQAVISSNIFIDRLKEKEALQEDAIHQQHDVIRQREDAVDAAREDLILASQELKALEKHKEKWAKEIKAERMRKQQENQDEVAQTLFLRRNKE